ncbi:MAG TPA: sigma-70 family RNA polymerase sigma factor [Candidatus Portnoybacteria bacterium]|nr:sigma-70 family RNA polymerase sigma factor [Candidatus Portnoybacteria bacterium]
MINEKSILKEPKLNKPDKEERVVEEKNLSNLNRYVRDVYGESPKEKDIALLIKRIEEILDDPNQKDEVESKEEIKKIRDEIILQELPFVIAIAKNVRQEFFSNGPKNILEDLIQYGNIGLIECVDLFIKKLYNGKKTKFSFTYARYYIKNYIMKGVNYVLRDIKIPLKTITLKIPQYRKTERQLARELGREPSIEEISQRLGWREEEVKNVIKGIETISLRNYVSFNQEIKPGERRYDETIADKNSLGMVKQIFEKEKGKKMAEAIEKILPSLTDREKDFLEMTLNNYSPGEISKKWGKTRTDAHGIGKAVIKKLKRALDQ